MQKGHPMQPLDQWMNGKQYFKIFDYYEDDTFAPEFIFVHLDHYFPAFEAPTIKAQPFEKSWALTKEYVANVCHHFGKTHAGWGPNSSDRKAAIKKFGDPPLQAYPLYFITIHKNNQEKLVYIGRTNSKKNRFTGGHAAFTKLLNPKFNGWKKRIYMAGVTVLTYEDHYIPLEWLHPRAFTKRLWKSIESQLIYHFQPELNYHLKATDKCEWPADLIVNNYSGTKFLEVEPVSAREYFSESDWDDIIRYC